ncbi:signal peptidase I, partial [archaeon]|nr:signal peptidase I [archaeon]
MFKDHKKKQLKTTWQKIWYFIWEDDSIWSWIVNIVLAFVLIKFIIYPGLGLLFGTSHPVVAVVSGSMEHKITYNDKLKLNMCGKTYDEKIPVDFDVFWDECGEYYRSYDINKNDFKSFSMHNGFNTGDIIVLFGRKTNKLEVGDIIVFRANQPDPIIHRIVKVWTNEGKYHFQTKGDHNSESISYEKVYEIDILEDRVIGKAVLRIPYLGYIKIWFIDLLRVLHLENSV